MGGAIGGIAGAVGNIVGGIAGQQASSGDTGEARNQAITANQILQEIQQAPDISKPLILQKYQQAGLLTPQMQQQINAAMPQTISTDPALRQAQMQALQSMQQRAAGGLTAADRAALNQARLAAQGDVQSRLGSIQQGMQQKGLADSGTNLAAQLAAAQGGATTASSAADQQAIQAQQAALQAASQAGQLGGQMEQQQFGEAAQQQQAQQQMERFNVQNQLGVQQQNVAAANQAQAGNLANAQSISNQNVAGQNQELNNQLQRQMQQYGANTNRAIIQSGGANQLSGNLNQMGQQAGQAAYNQWAGAGQAVGGLAGAFGSGGGSGGGQSAANAGSSSMFSPYSGGVQMIAHEGGQVPDYRQGGVVPGKANVPGDSPKNDTVHAMVSPQEIIVPRSLADSKLGRQLVKLIHAHNSVKHQLNQED